MPQPGRLFGLGVGPGDPELITLKALRLLQAAPVVAYHAAKGKKGNALTIVERYLDDKQLLVPAHLSSHDGNTTRSYELRSHRQ